MSRRMNQVAGLIVVASIWSLGTAQGQIRQTGGQVARPALLPGGGQRVRPIPNYSYQPARSTGYLAPQHRIGSGQPGQRGPTAHRIAGGYPYLGAPLYSSPRQNVPYQTGGVAITNQAFAPHEMLYPHTYHAMYPPYYYRVHGSWMVTPWGVWSHDKWRLQGTEVRVKYSPRIPFFNAFRPPIIR